ncbi:MAG: outer membrane beta-barrel protein, partial [Peristeroidobacter soli]
MKKHHHKNNISRAPLLLPAALACVALPAIGQEAAGLAYDISVGGGYSDNIMRSAVDPEAETIGALGLRFSLDQQTSRLNAEVVSDLAYYDYMKGDIESELVGTVEANADVTLIEERLQWFVRDSFGQVLGDPFLPSAPDNRDDLNYLSTGLTAMFNFGSSTRLDLQGSYALSTYDQLNLDSDTVLVEMGLMHNLSEDSSFGARLRGAQVTYDETAYESDYDVTEGVLSYGARGARTEIEAEVGYAKLNLDNGSEDEGPIFRLTAARSLSTHPTLTLDAGQEFSNSAQAFNSYSSGRPAGLDSYGGQQTADPFTNSYGRLTWDVAGARTQVAVRASWEEQDYGDLAQVNEELTSIGVTVRRDLTAALSGQLMAEYGAGDFDGLQGDYKETRLGLAMRWQFARTLSLSFSYDHGQRDD